MRPVMAGLVTYEQWLWAFSIAVEIALFASMAVRKYYRSYPAFFSYIGVDLLQAGALFAAYSYWGFNAPASEHFSWETQVVVLCARAWAIAEICRHLLGQYAGIWALARSILLFCAAAVASFSIYTAGWKWSKTVLAADTGLEFTIGVVLVVLFLFARYYEIVPEPTVRIVAIGFFLFSCFRVVNDTILQHSLARYVEVWRLLGGLAFFASLTLWLSAFRKPVPALVSGPALLPGEIYRTLAPQVNLRLRRLNDQLSKLGSSRARRS